MQAAAHGSTFSQVTVGVVSNAVFALLLWLGHLIYARTARRNPIYRRQRLIGMLVIWGTCNVFVFWMASGAWPSFFLLSLIIAGIVVFNELNQFWKIGLVGADRQVKAGIGYVAALTMCKSSLDFLGIGASKLIEHQKDFREAIDRCHRSDKPVRLLLSRPICTIFSASHEWRTKSRKHTSEKCPSRCASSRDYETKSRRTSACGFTVICRRFDSCSSTTRSAS